MFKRIARNDKGATAVEFALVLPIFLLLIFGIIDFGWYFFVEHTLQYATREGMRLALVGKTLKDGNGNPMSREDSIKKTIRDNALAVDSSSLSIYIYPVNSDYTDPLNWKDPNTLPNAGGAGQYMRVRTQYTYTFMMPFIGAFFPGGTIIVEAQGTYRNELFDT